MQRIVLIGSASRSGSTLLDLMLGQLPGWHSGGELKRVWTKGVVSNYACSCGLPFHDCPFWTRVGDEAFGGWARVDAEQEIDLRRKLDRHRYLPFLIAPRGRYARLLSRLIDEFLAPLYQAVRTVSRCTVLVDSSKDPPYLYLLRHLPASDLRLVQIVRDPRGVAHSLQRRVLQPDAPGRYMPRASSTRAALHWTDYNMLLHGLERFGLPRLLVRYEDLAGGPGETISRISAFAGVDGSSPPIAGEGAVELRDHHVVGGNPMRFKRGRIQVREDDAWKHEMPRRDRALTAALTLPLLVHYGYGVSASRSRGR
ncbi:MAG: sulfotransferase [Chloroflexota bacterium]|nr:sulfotransferase [Chloroflexota bacterium]